MVIAPPTRVNQIELDMPASDSPKVGSSSPRPPEIESESESEKEVVQDIVDDVEEEKEVQ